MHKENSAKIDNKEFHSNDLPLVVTLVLSGNSIIKSYKSGKQTFFVFSDKILCESIRDDFVNQKLKVDPFRFSKLLKQIRNFIKDQVGFINNDEKKENENNGL